MTQVAAPSGPATSGVVPPPLGEAAAPSVLPPALGWAGRLRKLLQRLRLQRAALLLASRADSVKQLAEQCGFKNEYHFSTAFKRQHGLAPSHYRSLHHPAFKTGQG